VAAGCVLCECGFDFLASENEAERFMLSVASCNESQESVLQWLKEMTKEKSSLTERP
jgi:hypothetical protein